MLDAPPSAYTPRALYFVLRVQVCTSCAAGELKIGGYCLSSANCKGGKFLFGKRGSKSVWQVKDRSCGCPDRNCHRCSRTATGSVCLVCKNGSYLSDGACVAQCPGHTTALGTGDFQRRCLEPFTCKRGGIFELSGSRVGTQQATPQTLPSVALCMSLPAPVRPTADLLTS